MKMKRFLLSPVFAMYALGAALAMSFGCATTPSGAASTVTPAQAAVIQNDISAVAGLVLTKNPAYKPAVAALGATLPSLAANGPITPSTWAAAVAGIPGIPVQEQTDLVAAGVGLDLALTTYEAFSGKTVALYTDPNVAAIVNAFAAGLVQASK